MASSPRLDFDSLVSLALAGGYNSSPALSQLSAVFLLSACVPLREKWLWQKAIDPISGTQYESILELIEQAEADLMTSFAIGQIIPSITQLTSDNLALLDGSILAQSDYPELTAIVPTSWLSGADIVLPNMDITGLFGTDDSLELGTFTGENEHTLSISELPSHNHTQNPHNHTEVIPTVIVTAAGLEPALASLVTATPSLTGLATATNNPTGGDLPHNNIQSSMFVFYYLVVR